MKLNLSSRALLIFTVLLAYFLSGVEIDLIVPGFPEIQKIFGLSPFRVELLLGANMAAHCVAALWMGALGDTLGKKRVILGGLGLFIGGSFLTLLPTHYEVILLGRILQGIGIAGPNVLAYLLFADLYSVSDQQKMLGTLNGIVWLGMACAPVAGSYIAQSFHWQGNFLALLVLGVVVFLFSVWVLPEDSQDHHPFTFSLKGYLPVLKTQKTCLFILSICLTAVPFFIFIGLSPLLYVGELGVSLSDFGFYQGVQALGCGLLGFCSAALVRRFGNRRCLKFGLFSLSLFCVSALSLGFSGSQNPTLMTLCVLAYSLGSIFPYTIFFPVSLTTFMGASGRISGLVVSFRFILTATSLQMASLFYNGTFMSVASCMVVIVLCLFGCYFLLWKNAPEAWE